MKLLVKGDGMTELAMHLANAMGTPLCGIHLQREVWHIQAQPTAQGIICEHCRHIHTAAFGNIEGSAVESEYTQEQTHHALLMDLEYANGARRSDTAMDRSSQLPALLVVDDDPYILALLQAFLHNLVPSYDIITTCDAQSALRHLANRTVLVLITDYLMPGMNGRTS